jgi:hypothetical protein
MAVKCKSLQLIGHWTVKRKIHGSYCDFIEKFISNFQTKDHKRDGVINITTYFRRLGCEEEI